MGEKHGHKHPGKSSRDVLSAGDVLKNLDLKKGDKFLDAGCGDGYISMEASKLVEDEGKVYAVDVYEKSIDALREEIQNRGITNIETKIADMTKKIPLKDNSIDKCVMANVMHGFVAEGEVPEVMEEIRRVIKPEGTFALVEFRKIQSQHGPPFEIRLTPADVEDVISPYGFQVQGSEEIGTYHYIVKAVKTE
jgi:ubiquinone/menaquinone biosynthesis C-methylase UbiE